MEDNEKCTSHSTIERSNIGTIINGDVDMQCPVFSFGGEPLGAREGNLEDLVEDQKIWKELLHRARLWAALRPLLTALVSLLMLAELSRFRPSTDIDWLMLPLLYIAIPITTWFAMPAGLKERHRSARRKIKAAVAELDKLEARIAYLKLRERNRQRQQR